MKYIEAIKEDIIIFVRVNIEKLIFSLMLFSQLIIF